MQEVIMTQTLKQMRNSINKFHRQLGIDPITPDTNEWTVLENYAKRLGEMKERVETLENAIKKHANEFPDEPLQGELDLWELVGIDRSQDFRG
jgi:hypothetical protein